MLTAYDGDTSINIMFLSLEQFVVDSYFNSKKGTKLDILYCGWIYFYVYYCTKTTDEYCYRVYR